MSGDLAGLTLEAILGTSRGNEKPAPRPPSPPPPISPPSAREMNRTLLDIIRDEEPNGSLFGKDKKSWKTFRDRLRLKRAGAAWTSTIHVPASDIPIQNRNNAFNNVNTGNSVRTRSLMSRRTSVRYTTLSPFEDNVDDVNDHENYDQSIPNSGGKPFMVRRISSRYGVPPSRDDNIQIFRDEIPSRHSSRKHEWPYTDGEENEAVARDGVGANSRRFGTVVTEERTLSAREAVAAQEAAEAEAAAAAAAAEEEEEEEVEYSSDEGYEAREEGKPVKMSLMDLLEETDRQMGVVGSKYAVGEDEEEEECEEDDEDDDGNGIEHTCCVCMVRHKGAAFIPCGHTFCRLCSRELYAQRGNCPICNGFIAEILDIF